MAKRESKQFWAAHVAAVVACGANKAAYCREHGLNYKSLLRRSVRLRQCDGAASPSQSFVPVAIREATKGHPARLTLRIGTDIALAMPISIDAVWLGTVLRTVSAC